MPSRRIKITLRPGQVSQNLMRRCSVEADNVEAVTRRVPSLRRGLKQNLRAIEPTSGRILAMINQKMALSSGAQPCSTIKLSVALAALSEGIITHETQVRL